MTSCKSIYEPQEDSSMLETSVRKHAKGRVLDIGTGSGIQAIAAAQSSKVYSVIAVDIQQGVADYCKKNISNRKIKFLQSDLFTKVKGRFDTIIFNPPYLPQELKLRDLTLEGGKKGYETIQQFLGKVNGFLNPDGIILLVFSSLTKKKKVEELIGNALLDFKELEKMHVFFEDIYVYLLTKSEFLKKIEAKGISDIKYLAKGHRGLVYTGNLRTKKVAIKTENPASKSSSRIKFEADWLKRVNRHGIGPKFISFEDGMLVRDYVDGQLIMDYLKNSTGKKIRAILKGISDQMYALDGLKIDKEEMHHPVKHVIVSQDEPVLIDFERCRYTLSPKNVTQFCQFLSSRNVAAILKTKQIYIDRNSLLQSAKSYKRNPDDANFRKITGLI